MSKTFSPMYFLFQSAPLTDVRGDFARPCATTWRESFQSAPLTDVRGDKPDKPMLNLNGDVSIRSPHGCKGRFVKLIGRFKFKVCFNPLPSRM